jgi:hypothetical protein
MNILYAEIMNVELETTRISFHKQLLEIVYNSVHNWRELFNQAFRI